MAQPLAAYWVIAGVAAHPNYVTCLIWVGDLKDFKGLNFMGCGSNVVAQGQDAMFGVQGQSHGV